MTKTYKAVNVVPATCAVTNDLILPRKCPFMMGGYPTHPPPESVPEYTYV